MSLVNTLPPLGPPDELSGNARPAKRTSLIIDETELQIDNYCAVTFNRLLTAPVIRLECWFDGISHPSSGRYDYHVVLEFHFNDIDDGTPGIQNFHIRRGIRCSGQVRDEIAFIAHGATCEGFNNASRLGDVLASHEKTMIEDLRGLIKPAAPKHIRLPLRSSLNNPDSALAKLLPFLQGPAKLKSLSLPEWGAVLPLTPDPDFEKKTAAAAHYPMVSFECGYTYPTITQASIELYESARCADLEQHTALRAWASVDHEGILYQVGGVVVLAVRFRPFPCIDGPAGFVRFDLPDRVAAHINWKDPCTATEFKASATRSSVPIRLAAWYDALFVLDQPSAAMREACLGPMDADPRRIALVHFAPSTNDSTLRRRLNAAINMRHPDASRWHQIILNQRHDTLEVIDIAKSRVDDDVSAEIEAAVEEAFKWMMRWRKWNFEQEQALRSIRHAVGGVVLITGPAGTGKTLVMQAICVFFYKLGLHVLVMAPANSNCTDFMGRLAELFPEIPATRVLPPSFNFDPEKIAKSQSKCQHSEYADGTRSDILDFEMVRASMKSSSDKYGPSEYGLHAQVLNAARNGDSPKVGIWQELRTHIEASDVGTFDWSDKEVVKKYGQAYEECKAHFLSLRRLIVTTTGNVRSDDIINNWATNKNGLTCEGIVIILDEACKDTEIDSLSALLIPNYRRKIMGMIMLGDERQLEPTNMCAKGRVTFNPFNDRLNIPLLSRLKHEGFPCVELVEQHRMSHQVAAWPSKNFYPPGMRNSRSTYTLLRHKKPGLFDCLMKILAGISPLPPGLSDVQMDEHIRTHYLEIQGERDTSKMSPFVTEHIQVFFDKVYWTLLAYYGEKMEENVMIICAYKEAKARWHEVVLSLQQRFRIPNAQMPRLLTIDSSQGCEAPVTFIDCSVQRFAPRWRRRDIGFVDDDKRMNVAMTRAQEVRWFLGGDCSSRQRVRGLPNTPAYVRHKDEIAQVSVVGNRRLEKGDRGWVDALQMRRVGLAVRHRDEAGAER